jgi:hypothetical protein
MRSYSRNWNIPPDPLGTFFSVYKIGSLSSFEISLTSNGGFILCRRNNEVEI